MHKQNCSLSAVVLLLLLEAGCEPRFEVMPTYATRDSYADEIDYESMPAATRQLYDAIFDGRLRGGDAATFQPLLDTAQLITERESFIIYEFQLTDFDRLYEDVKEEGVPLMAILVQKKYGLIYKCDVAAPCF